MLLSNKEFGIFLFYFSKQTCVDGGVEVRGKEGYDGALKSGASVRQGGHRGGGIIG